MGHSQSRIDLVLRAGTPVASISDFESIQIERVFVDLPPLQLFQALSSGRTSESIVIDTRPLSERTVVPGKAFYCSLEDLVKGWTPDEPLARTKNLRPKVGVVTPSYNHADFIRETIVSVLSQDYPNIEYIVVDGNSTDSTREILAEYDHQIRWVSEPDQGYADAVRKGFELTDAEYLMWLPSDDLLADRAAVSALVDEIERRQLDILYGEGLYFDKDQNNPTGVYPSSDYSAELLVDNCFICQPATIFRSQIYRKVDGIQPRWKSIADYDLWLRFCEAGARFGRSHRAIAFYRLQPNSITVSQRKKTYREIFEMQFERWNVVSHAWVTGGFAELFPRAWKVPLVRKFVARVWHRSWFQKLVYWRLRSNSR